MKVFFDNSEAIETFNKRANETYTRAISEHSDMTLEEKKKFRLGLKSPLRTRSFYPVPLMFINITLIPEKGGIVWNFHCDIFEKFKFFS